jgi:uncharacterized membrane protein
MRPADLARAVPAPLRGHDDLALASGAALGFAFLAVVVPFEIVSMLFAAPLALFLPGYALTAAAFGSRLPPLPQLVVLSIGLSLATLVVGALALNYVPGGIGEASWALLLVAVVLGGAVVAARRRQGPADLPRRPSRLLLGRPDTLYLAGALVVAAIAMGLGWTTLPAENAIGYTQLWMLPSEDGQGVRVGVVSQEKEATEYGLQLRSGNGAAPVTTRVALVPGEEHVFNVPVEAAPGGKPVPVVALLYREDEPLVVYRRVTGSVSPPAAAP